MWKRHTVGGTSYVPSVSQDARWTTGPIGSVIDDDLKLGWIDLVCMYRGGDVVFDECGWGIDYCTTYYSHNACFPHSSGAESTGGVSSWLPPTYPTSLEVHVRRYRLLTLHCRRYLLGGRR
jgi:hypothetical protein